MNFNQYVDDLAKRGIIDGHIAEMLTAKHKEECANPFKPVRDAVMPILNEMWKTPRTVEEAHYADVIDDAISTLERGAK